MWDNIGRKLQGLAKFVCWVGIIGSIIAAIVIWSQNNPYQSTILTGILYLVFGCFGSWIGSWAMYGLGLVVEHVENGGAISSTVTSHSGTHSSDDTTKKAATNYWTCPKCNSHNPLSRITCKDCGMTRSL